MPSRIRRPLGAAVAIASLCLLLVAANAAAATIRFAGPGGIVSKAKALTSAGEVDPTPETTLKKKPRTKTASHRATFTFLSSQPGSTFQCKLDKRPFKPCSSPFKVRKLKEGRHLFKVKAVNAAGVADPEPALFRWKVS